MKKKFLCLLAFLAVTGCASKNIIPDGSGDGSSFFYMSGYESKAGFIELRSKALKGKLTPNFYDYEGQYYLNFINAPSEVGSLPSTKSGNSLSTARSVADTVMATDLIGSAVLRSPSLFGKGFNIGMLGLSAIAPKSPEESFVNDLKLSSREFASRGLTLMKVDSIQEGISDQEIELFFQRRMSEIRATARKGGLLCDSRPEYVTAGLYRSNSLIGAECDFNGAKIKVARKSWLTMPGSILREASGPSIVSKVVFYSLKDDARDLLLASHGALLEQGWVAIYPENQIGLAKKIVVQSAKQTKKFDPPKPVES